MTGDIAAQLAAASDNATQQYGFVYDETSGLYYDHNTGLYYDQVSSTVILTVISENVIVLLLSIFLTPTCVCIDRISNILRS